MKMTNIFGKNGSLLVAGALAFTFASCDTDTRSNQSTQREAENMYETETNEGADINDPSISYEDGEYQNTTANAEDNYDYDREYSFEERDVVVERVRNDIQRAEQSLQELEQQMNQTANETNADIKDDLEEIREDLQETREELNEKLQELESSTQENWNEVRTETNESLRNFERDRENMGNRSMNNNSEGVNNNNNNNNTNMENSEDVRGVAPGTGTRTGEGQ